MHSKVGQARHPGRPCLPANSWGRLAGSGRGCAVVVRLPIRRRCQAGATCPVTRPAVAARPIATNGNNAPAHPSTPWQASIMAGNRGQTNKGAGDKRS